MDLQLSGRRAVITGGSGAIGRAVGKALDAEGCDVCLVGRERFALDQALAYISNRAGANNTGVIGDTGEDASVAEMARSALELLGGVDILVNTAARANVGAPFSDEDMAAEINVKVSGYLRCARAFAPGMKAAGWGRIINIGGLAVRHGGNVVGAARNAAVAAMTKVLGDELGPYGVNVTVVHPGTTLTERLAEQLEIDARRRGVTVPEVAAELAAGVSIGRIPTADEVAAVVTFLASPLSVAINGDAIAVGGGQVGAIYY
jgi:NAD(P)-dependent dehydrogenase (short-subunit alcohol dehydrogenase family)